MIVNRDGQNAGQIDRAVPLAPSLRNVYLEPTSRCTLACEHCYVARPSRRHEEELTGAELLALVPQLADLGVRQVILTGGEPLLRRDVLPLIEELAARRIKVVVSSNGLLLSREVLQFLAGCGPGVELFISLDGLTPESHNALRDPNGGASRTAFDRAVDAVARTVRSGLPTCVSTMIHRGNVHELSGICRWLGELGVTYWWLAVPKKLGRYVETRARHDVEAGELAPALFRLLDDYLGARAGGRTELKLEIEGLFRMQMLTEGLASSGGGSVCARCNANGCAVQPGGEVARCVYLGGMPVGNLRQRSLASLWESGEMQRLVGYPVSQVSACVGCRYADLCGAGCRANAWAEGGSFFDGKDATSCVLARLAHDHLAELLGRHGFTAPGRSIGASG